MTIDQPWEEQPSITIDDLVASETGSDLNHTALGDGDIQTLQRLAGAVENQSVRKDSTHTHLVHIVC